MDSLKEDKFEDKLKPLTFKGYVIDYFLIFLLANLKFIKILFIYYDFLIVYCTLIIWLTL